MSVHAPMMRHVRTACEWLALLADEGTCVPLAAAGASPHLARYGIVPRDDDGVSCARLAIDGQVFLAAVQHGDFLGGSVGARHGARLAALLREARTSRTPAILVMASGGVRLHEANPAEVALAMALKELVDTRASGVPVLAITAGDVFGGASVLACAASRLAMLDGTRLGLSGPKVIATARGPGELDPGNMAAMEALFGADARVALGLANAVRDSAPALRAWCIARAAAAPAFADAVAHVQRQLTARVRTVAADAAFAVTTTGERTEVGALQAVVTAGALNALDAALLALPAGVRTLVLVEDSEGHEASRAAEAVGLSQYLAQHACVLGVLRARGIDIVGVLEGTGHSAAFFSHALQSDRLYVLPQARVVAMAPAAIAQVTGIALADVAARIDDDPLLGQPARHLVALGAATPVARRDSAV
jgi:malonate decarboxylase beta subunit